MKPLYLKILILLFVLGLSLPSFAQQVLPEVEIVAVNYKYLSATNNKEASPTVQQLQRKVASYDLKSADFYEDDYGTYLVSFYIPEGNILAAYDKEGNLIRTAEKFKNTNLPLAVSTAIANKYPGWHIVKDVYRVNYHNKNGVSKKYTIVLEKGDDRKRIKIDENGEFF